MKSPFITVLNHALLYKNIPSAEGVETQLSVRGQTNHSYLQEVTMNTKNYNVGGTVPLIEVRYRTVVLQILDFQ